MSAPSSGCRKRRSPLGRSIDWLTSSWGTRATLRAAESYPAQPVEALLELEGSRDRIGLRVGDLDVRDLPFGEGPLDVGAADAAGERAPPTGGETVEDERGVGPGDGAHLHAHRGALGTVEAVEGAGVEQQPEAGAEVGICQSGHVGLRQPKLDTLFVGPSASAAEGFRDDVHAGHLPAALRELHAPDPAAGAQVERPAVRRLAALLLPAHQLLQLVGKGRMLGEVLPRMESDRVGEPVVHCRLPSRAAPNALRNASGCSSGASSPAPSITWSGHPKRSLTDSATRSRIT